MVIPGYTGNSGLPVLEGFIGVSRTYKKFLQTVAHENSESSPQKLSMYHSRCVA